MNPLKLTLLILLFASLAACSRESKKVVIMCSGTLTIDKENIKVDPGTQHNEQIVSFGDGKIALTIQTPQGENKVEITDNGLYVLNLKLEDTLAGGIVNYGAVEKRERVSDEGLNYIIDSTRRLILGVGADDKKKTYYIVPFTAKKISDDLNSIVVGPYESIPYQLDKKDGKLPEVYKLYTLKQQIESLRNLFKRMR